ncbi:MAG: peptidase M10, partial [Bacteroidetes bacterium]|nr:peptidase M10 [Bacteroidota bacterium]
GKGQPGIMYPRGTICDPQFQYDVNALPLQPGGTLNPFTRKVLTSDINDLRLHRLSFKKGFATLGDFTSIYHQKHPLP